MAPVCVRGGRACTRHEDPASPLQTVAAVLDECGSDIDQAIQRLNQLQIDQEHARRAAEGAAAGPAGPSGGSTPTKASRPASGDGGAAGGGSAPGPRSAEEWVDVVVSEMAAASDVQDARARAAGVLQAFQRAVLETTADSRRRELEPLKHKMGELIRDNTILKKAVQARAVPPSLLSSAAARASV